MRVQDDHWAELCVSGARYDWPKLLQAAVSWARQQPGCTAVVGRVTYSLRAPILETGGPAKRTLARQAAAPSAQSAQAAQPAYRHNHGTQQAADCILKHWSGAGGGAGRDKAEQVQRAGFRQVRVASNNYGKVIRCVRQVRVASNYYGNF